MNHPKIIDWLLAFCLETGQSLAPPITSNQEVANLYEVFFIYFHLSETIF